MLCIYIAVCDEDQTVCGSLETFLIELFKERSVKCEIDMFSNGEALCQRMEQYNYDLLFLEIELPGKNGIEIGHFIRDKLQNEQMQIVYISSKTDCAMSLFQFYPINFLEKPLVKEKIQPVVDKYLRTARWDSRIFTYQKNRRHVRTPVRDIIYFESIKRKVRIITSLGEDEFYSTLKEIYLQLQDTEFLYIHHSILVNSRHIKSYGYEQIVMDNQMVLPISQSHRKSFKDNYLGLKAKEPYRKTDCPVSEPFEES